MKRVFLGFAVIAVIILSSFQNCSSFSASNAPFAENIFSAPGTIVTNPVTSRVQLRFAPFQSSLSQIKVCLSNIKFHLRQANSTISLPNGKTEGGFDLSYFFNDSSGSGGTLTGVYFENLIQLSQAGTTIGQFLLPAGQYDQVVFGLSLCQTSAAPPLQISSAQGTFSDALYNTIALSDNQLRSFSDGGSEQFDISQFISALDSVSSNSQLGIALSGYRDFSLLGFSSESLNSAPGTLLTMRKLTGLANGQTLATGLYDNGDSQLVVARYNTDGSIDTQFASQSGRPGMRAIPMTFAYGVSGAAVASDGSIYAVSERENSTTRLYDLAIVKLDGNGNPVSSFGNQGVVDFNVAGENNHGEDVGIEPNGDVIALGETDSSLALARIHPDGTFETTFGTNGVATHPMNFWTAFVRVSLAIQPDGKIVVAAYDNYNGYEVDWRVLRFLANGQIDSTFGVNGITTVKFGANNYSVTTGIALQPDGKILISGSDQVTAVGQPSEDFLAARLNVDGSLDSTFGAQGLFRYKMDGYQEASGVAVLTSGNIVVSGVATSGSTYNYMVLSLSSSGTNPQANFYLANPGAQGGFVNAFPDGRIVVGGSVARFFDFLNVQ